MHKYERNLENLLESVFDNASLIIYTWDLDGKILRFNSYAEKVTGYREKEVVGKSWLELFIEEEEEAKKVDGLIRYIKTGRNLQHSIGNLWQTKFDTYIELIWTTSPIFDKDNNVIEMVSYGTNITDHKNIVRKLNRLAYYDDLTGLPNRKLAEEEVNKIIKKARKAKLKLALLSINIDNLKQVNDSIGYEAGNKFLKFISEILKENEDICHINKFNGNKFGLVFYDVKDKKDIIKKTKRLLESFKQPWIAEDYNFQVKVSIGISIYPDNGENFSDLNKTNNMAMYKAREDVTRGYLFYNDKMKDQIEKNIFIINNIEKSMKIGHFSLYYQAITRAEDNSIYGVEALIRWFHPQEGYISPMDFIPLIEESGQIKKITTMILNIALEQKRRWNERGYRDLKMTVNISSKSILGQDLYEELEVLLEEYNIGAEEIVLEITETAFLDDIDICNPCLNRLRKAGLEIALDDFGTGYSSLAKLNGLPVEYLKVDKSFIDTIEENNREEALVKYIIDLANTLKLKTIAEGVETKEQLEILKKIGCDLIQGYYLAKPMPAHELEEKFLFLEEGDKSDQKV